MIRLNATIQQYGKKQNIVWEIMKEVKEKFVIPAMKGKME